MEPLTIIAITAAVSGAAGKFVKIWKYHHLFKIIICGNSQSKKHIMRLRQKASALRCFFTS